MLNTGRSRLYLVIDQGGHASRAMVMDESGRTVTVARRPLATSRPDEGFVEHDPLELIDTVSECLTETLAKLGQDRERLVSAGLAAQRSTIACFSNSRGKALTPVISWQDTRAWDRFRDMTPLAGNIHHRTGLFLSAHYGASKLSWCLKNIPAVKEAYRSGDLRFGPMSSFLVWMLNRGGPFLTDPVSASRTLLWNIHEKIWDPYLLDLFQIPGEALPSCVQSVSDFGEIQLERHGIPLQLVTGDQSAALYAYGQLRQETLYVNMGTGAFLSCPLGQKPVIVPGLLTSIVHEQEGISEYVLEGTVNGAGSAIQWVRSVYKVENIWKLLPGWLERVKEPPLFLNGISGVGSPYWIPDLEPAFIGKGGVAEKVVAVVESVVFLLYRNFVEMKNYIAEPERILVSGGLAALDGMCQLLADLTRKSVYRRAETEATARGTCYLLAGKPDHWPESAPGMQFDPREKSLLGKRYHRWLEEMERNMIREE